MIWVCNMKGFSDIRILKRWPNSDLEIHTVEIETFLFLSINGCDWLLRQIRYKHASNCRAYEKRNYTLKTNVNV